MAVLETSFSAAEIKNSKVFFIILKWIEFALSFTCVIVVIEIYFNVIFYVSITIMFFKNNNYKFTDLLKRIIIFADRVSCC